MRIFTMYKWILILCAISIYTTASAQPSIENILATRKTRDGRYNFIKFDLSKGSQLRNQPQPERVKRIFGLGAKHSFVQNVLANNNPDFRADKQGLDHARYNQLFNGVKVEHGVITLHRKNGDLSMVTGDYLTIDENFATTPSIAENVALNNAIAFIGARKYSWQDNTFNNPLIKGLPKGELVICRNFAEEGNSASSTPKAELAYKFAIYATEPLRYDNIYVSARTGNIILVDPIIKDVDGIAATRYSGSRTIATTQLSPTNYVLKDSGGNYNIATYNMNRSSSYTTASNFSDNDNNWTAAEYNNINYDNAAMDAHWGAMMTLDYWRTVHNRNSFDNKGSRINSYVHFTNLYPNAFWDGYEMTYGDGNGTTMFPLTSIDICGHEIGHGVCQYTANLIYSNESGAMNEGFSDIWGACIKKYADPTKNTWLLGEEISSTSTPIRSMSNPKSQGQPNTYKGANWFTGTADNGGVHTNSGVLNYWFYLLSEGKAGTNDRGVTYNVSGIGITKAAQITYRAENVYLYPAAVYTDARTYTIQAAEDLFGAGSNEVRQTTEAWKAVGVTELLARPDSVSATFTNNSITLNWRFASSQTIEGFQIERAVNGLNNFVTVAIVSSDVRNFIDSSYINNSLNQYRIRSFRADSTYSDYSQTASLAAGNAPLIMTNGSYATCAATFFDPGGQGNYSSGNNTMTLRPATAGNRLQIAFSLFSTYDNLYVYNGPTTSSPLLGTYYGTTLPPVLQSTAAGGELTFVFNPYNSNVPGWKANITCFKPVTAPGRLLGGIDVLKRVRLFWADSATDESGYIVERSINDSTHFQQYATLPSNTTTYIDSLAPDNSFLYYRVKAYRDSISSPYSNTLSVINGSLYSMQNGSTSTCGTTFLDPGGPGNYSYGNYTTTIRPATTGNKLRIVFNQFNTGYDYLYVYSGPSSSSTFIGSYTSTTLPPTLQSTAAGGELTFVFNPSSSNSYPGWSAYISCYKPVTAPSNLIATKNNVKDIQLTWTDSANDEAGFIVERSLNDSLHYLSLINLPANTSGYNDTTAPDNGYLYYRVKAYRDSLTSFYSNSASVINGTPYVMQTGSFSTCNSTFLDPGGTGNYSNGSYTTTTLRPATAGNVLRVAFSQFNVGYDNLAIYNGPTSSSPVIGNYSGTTSIPFIQSTAKGGELTFVFNAYSSNTNAGWVANVSCYKPVGKPSGVKGVPDSLRNIKLSWTDNADDETKLVVERSINAPLKYSVIAQLPPNATQFTDSVLPANSLVLYRIRAYRDTASSYYSDTAMVPIGNAPFPMMDSTLVTCDKVFLDQAGTDIMPNGRYFSNRTTFKPAINGNHIKVVFSKFKTNTYLFVYNGPSNNYPQLATMSNYYSSYPLAYEGTGPDGSLTFVSGGTSYGDTGWIAQVSCYKPVAKPTGVTAVVNGAQNVNLTWRDNADDETKYIIERSINSPTQYRVIGQIPFNSTQFNDTDTLLNSLLFYRIRAVRDTDSSYYSDTASVAIGNAPFLIKDSTLITCDKVFMDPGGLDIIPPTNGYYNYRTTFKPGIAGRNITVTFSKFRLSSPLYVYNGSSTSSAFIGSYSGNYVNPGSLTFNSTATDGALTFVYQGYSSTDSGWVAQVSCYRPVAKPSGLKATIDSSQRVKLTWTDNADDETKYIIERSVNAPSLFTPVAQLPANTNQYIDSSAPANSLLYYRVKAYLDTLGSFYSDTTSVAFGNAPFLMKDSTLITCDKLFLDPGGADIIPINNYYNYRTTFKPAIAGNNIRIFFSKLKINGTLYVYNGSSTSSSLIGSYNGNSTTPLVFNGTGTEGSVTLNYQGYSYSDTGWVAQVSCYKPVAKPTTTRAVIDSSQNINITWKDNADDETKYVLERSVNAPSQYVPIAQLQANAIQYTDSAAPANSLLFYRVKAYRDTLGSFYSDTTSVGFGNAPFLMKDSILTTCDKIFMDAGGTDVLSQGNYTFNKVTFKPGINGNNIRASFSKLRLNATLSVYNGPSNSSPLLGTYTGYYSNPLVFNATGTDGSLTFLYQGYSYSDSGWLAQISCYKPVTKPNGLKALQDSSQRIKLTWTDNADDETKYIVERSVNANSLFTSIVQLPVNTTQYTDSTVPANSLVYYRIRASRDTLRSLPSDTAFIANGNTPFLMKDSTMITCNKVFMDPGGLDVIPPAQNGYYNLRTTFKPGVSGNYIKVAFSRIKMNSYLSVYDGPTTNSPLLSSTAYYYGGSPTFKASGADGSLTFTYQGYPSADSGWIAQVSCYKPVAAPTNFTVDTLGVKDARLRWNDNANNEVSYVVERSITDSLNFKVIASLPANTTNYVDTTAPNNGFMYYRVAAYLDSNSFTYSNTASLITGSPLIMQNTIVSTCSAVFLDPGGNGNYGSGNYTETIKPATAGNVVRVQFSQFYAYDYLYVYDGPTASSPRLGYYYGTTSPPLLQGSSPGGELTFVFSSSSSSSSYPGWLAYLSCYKPVLKPTGIKAISDSSSKINITWTDKADDETKYVVERSVNAPSLYAALAQLPANTTQYTDSVVPANSVVYYRVRAYRDTAGSNYSDTASVAFGNAPFLMKDSTLITCNKIFMDPGGSDIMSSNTYYNIRTTFKPGVAGNNIRVAFRNLKLGNSLYVYNGPSTSSPQIGYLSYYSNPLTIFSSTAVDGSLTFYYSGSSTDSGWEAHVSCYKPVAKPSAIKVITDSSSMVKLTWKDNADDETKYIVERSVNAYSLFTPVAQLPPNSVEYIDSSAPANSFLSYRLKAYRDTTGSLYGDTARINFGNAPFLMKDSTVVTCNKVFMDPGGADVIPGNSYTTYSTTFKPSIVGNIIQVSFSKLRINGNVSVYNGPSTNSPFIGSLNIYSNPLSTFTSTAPDGSLTFSYYSSNYSDSGWVAQVSCIKGVSKPSGVKAIEDSSKGVKITWNDNANDETKYVLERSVNAPSQYKMLVQLPANTIQYTDSTAPANSLIYYRVRAYRDTLYSLYSDTASIAFGNAPLLMKDTTVTTCSKVFMDPGGVDVIPQSSYNYRTTFKPASPGNVIKVAFSKLRFGGYLYVYNGPSSNSPLLASVSGSSSNLTPVFTSSASDGSLTFVYSGYSNYDSGWVAQVSCSKIVAKPSGIKATADTGQGIRVTWTDNADDETKYVVERSVNTPSKYFVVSQLPSNTSQFTDSAPPLNSLLYYRVRAYRDTVTSTYSDTATFVYGDALFLMKDSTLITCNKVFMDPGGIDIIPPGTYYNTHATFKPGISGNNIKVVFNKLALNGTLYVFDGLSTSSPLIGTLNSYNPNTPLSFSAKGADGALTFLYQGSSYSDSGWVAQVSCYKPVAAPTNLSAYTNNLKNVNLKWTDNANDETGYMVERSFNDSLNFLPLTSLAANATTYIDTSAQENSYVFYRIKGVRDSVISAYSNNVSVLNGNVFTMRSGKISACGITFLDPGGAGNYSNNINYTTTFIPAEGGKKVRATFSQFNTESCCDYLNVYNGPTASSPLIGTYLSSSIPPVLESSAPGGELTFKFLSDGAIIAPGWTANITCIKTNDTLATCSGDADETNTLTSNLTGSTYQWQKYNGKTFVNIYNDANTSATSTISLGIKNVALTVFEKFRCLVNGIPSREFIIIKGNRWTGNVSRDWNNPLNWSCGTVPNATTDILIEAGMINSPLLNNSTECRSLRLMPGAKLDIAPGVNLFVRH